MYDLITMGLGGVGFGKRFHTPREERT